MHPEIKELHMHNHIEALTEANHRAAKTMERMGGGFASALALAYFRADSDNQARILAAWPDLFERYRRIARELAGATEATET